MKRIIFALVTSLFFLPGFSFACEVCKKNQPAALRGITHGSGPEGQWDTLIISVAAVIVLFTLIYSIRFLVRPGEDNKGHIKNIVLEK